jgi:hypothetical protein
MVVLCGLLLEIVRILIMINNLNIISIYGLFLICFIYKFDIIMLVFIRLYNFAFSSYISNDISIQRIYVIVAI